MFTRFPDNPILEPRRKSWWEAAQTRNPAVVLRDGTVHLIYTAAADMDIEHKLYLGHAISRDGFHFERVSDEPFVQPSAEAFDGFDAGGVEDPRAVTIEGTTYITYCARAMPCWTHHLGGRHPNPPTQGLTWTKNYRRGGLLATEDMKTIRRLGPVTSDDHYDCNVILFPEKVDGRYLMLHRPSGWEGKDWGASMDSRPAIYLCTSRDMKTWEEDRPLMLPEFAWEHKIGGGCPPIKTEAGWLVLYHAVESPPPNGNWHYTYRFCYRAGLALLDLDDPRKVIARVPHPVLEPETPFEKFGTVNNVVFPTGHALLGDELFVYYGAADTVCCVATVKLQALLDLALRYRL